MVKSREKLWVCIGSNHPDYNIGDTIIANRLTNPDIYIDYEKEELFIVEWKFLCFTYELSDPKRNKEIMDMINEIKKNGGE